MFFSTFPSGDQKLSREEFDILLKVANNDKDELNYLTHFRTADKIHDGYVTAEELVEYFKTVGKQTIPLHTAVSFIGKNNDNRDGKLDYNGKANC